MRGLLTDFARHRSLRNQRRADLIIAAATRRAKHYSARADWWNDFRIWVAGLDTWAHLRKRRRWINGNSCRAGNLTPARRA